LGSHKLYAVHIEVHYMFNTDLSSQPVINLFTIYMLFAFYASLG